MCVGVFLNRSETGHDAGIFNVIRLVPSAGKVDRLLCTSSDLVEDEK